MAISRYLYALRLTRSVTPREPPASNGRAWTGEKPAFKPSRASERQMSEKKQQFRNTCIFCKGNKTSNEHIFPRWLRQFIPIERGSDDKSYHRTLVTKQPIGGASTEVFPKNTSNSVLSTQTKKVCTTCNNQWMSRLETEMMSLYEKLHRQSLTTLSMDDQRALSTWAILLAIKWDLTEVNTSGYSERHTHHVFQHKTPPPNTRIWLGYCEDGQVEIRHRTTVLLKAKPTRAHPINVRSTAIMLGTLVLHILSHETSSYPIIVDANKRNKKMVLIWPTTQELVMDRSMLEKVTSENLKSMSHFLGMQHSYRHVVSLIASLPELYAQT
jgi:hypothetical protein